MKRLLGILMLWSIFCVSHVGAQGYNYAFILKGLWGGSWITVPGVGPSGYGMYYFRKEVKLESVPEKLEVRVSGDQRYKFYVNGQLLSAGPARSDRAHWNYETIDIAPYLKAGDNVLAAQVINEGADKTVANWTLRTGFILDAPDAPELNTGASWQCLRDPGTAPKHFQLATLSYMVTGPGETVDMRTHVADWNQPHTTSDGWQSAEVIFFGAPSAEVNISFDERWKLQPSPLAPQELKREPALTIRQSTLGTSGKTLDAALTIPAHTEATLLLDQTYLTNAYVTLAFSGGKDSELKLGYTESLYTEYTRKGNRDEVDGKVFIGREDSLISNGQKGQVFTTMTFRTYRYLQLQVKTYAEPLTIDGLYGTFTGYPLVLNAHLDTDNRELQQMLQTGWRTARLCAFETYMDCPFYEQLQYLGDTRIQALITLYNSGDDTLVKNYLTQSDLSRVPEGVTQSRYPSQEMQFIPTYAISYVCALHDYLMLGSDTQFVREKLMGVRGIMDYMLRYQNEDGTMKKLPSWNFTDWVDGQDNWIQGVALPGDDGCNSVLDLQVLMGFQTAAALEEMLGGSQECAALYRQTAQKMQQTIRRKYWDAERGLFRDLSHKPVFSQHANALAILTGTVTGDEALRVAKKIQNDTTLAPASIYFKFYTHQAMIKAGLGDNYLGWLDIWREDLRMGLTTWGETSDVDATRSDCHAWGASPNIEFFRTILGISSEAPAFKRIKIEPHLGSLTKIGGSMPHPDGQVSVSYERKGAKLQATIEIPQGTSAYVVWNGHRHELQAGTNHIEL